MRLAIFDFDGTITSKDSFIDFIVYAFGQSRYVLGMLKNLPYLLAYKASLYPNDKTKEKVLAHFFGGMALERFRDLASAYSREQLPNIIKQSAMEKIRWHQAQGHDVVVVSASIDYWLTDWCRAQNIALIATHLEVVNGRITGRLASRNCYGAEKVVRVRELYHLDTYEYIYAYGDSAGDRELLDIAHEKGYRCFQ
jgi:phosphatidylglycerophosphatase C